MEGILGYIRFVLKIIILLIVRISTLFIFHNWKNFPPARLFHPARLLDSGEYTKDAWINLFSRIERARKTSDSDWWVNHSGIKLLNNSHFKLNYKHKITTLIDLLL